MPNPDVLEPTRGGRAVQDKVAARNQQAANRRMIQNELLLISRHLEDIEKAIRSKDYGYALNGLKDAKEAAKRMAGLLPHGMGKELERTSEVTSESKLTSRQRRQ